MERVGHRTALPAKAAISTGRRKTEDMREVWVEGKAGVSVGPNKENSEQGSNGSYPITYGRLDSHES
jgi:hypothetical protein